MKTKRLVKPYNPKKDEYVNSYIRKYQQSESDITDPKEKEKINKIKIKETLDSFSKDNSID